MKLYIPQKPQQSLSHSIVSASDKTEISVENLRKKTVLIVENDNDMLVILSSHFADQGMIVLTAQDGNEALDIERQCRGDIDFLITDIVLPKRNGVDLALTFQTLRPSTNIFMMSGYPANNFPSHIQIPHGMSIITKPIDLEKLVNKMATKAPAITHEDESLSSLAGLA